MGIALKPGANRSNMSLTCYTTCHRPCLNGLNNSSNISFKIEKNGNQEKWQFPNAIGAIDGENITIIPLPNSGSNYCNYKHTNSIVLLALADPNYECLFADVGSNGRMSDFGIWDKSSLHHAIKSGKMEFLEPRALYYCLEKVLFVIVGDDAFALKNYMMKPFPQRNLTIEKRICNYLHSCARRISENMFGILANCWIVFQTAMHLSPEHATSVTLSALILHNYLLKSPSKGIYFSPGFVDQEDKQCNDVAGSWHTELMTEESEHSLLIVMEITFQILQNTFEKFLWTIS